ncbi:sulfate adenylyltransferase subunit 1 [Humibacter ginsenosidimutans]|uniref:sulfate adenylyltransferase n=1 Tax=Humibacter ginsenosidimutans TaxID=2599293 RepID=A0A5B8M4H8_9MICO|nr:GTP-binding protein [Humibacter ginsenosidimutans]QDZ14490.1 sulfate adenylyltransferase [Humibacter ginsenosidimutans]
MTSTLFRFATAGSVDDGKSTLVGRLLHDSKSILADQWDAVTRASRQRGFGGGDRVDLALLTDGLRAEREQGITIDVAYRYFATDRRSFILADCPGHVQYTRNMVTGSTTADAVIVLIDVRKGVLEQTRRHLAVVQLLRVPHLLVAVNKIDLIGYDEGVFRGVEREVLAVASDLGIDDVDVVPVSALEGDNVVNASDNTPWYDGAPLLQLLETLEVIDEVENTLAPFRLPVQTVIRPQGALAPGLDPDAYHDYRAFAGQVASGSVRVGDEVTVLPAGVRTAVTGIDVASRALDIAVASQSVSLRLADEVDAARGSVIVAAGQEPELVSALTASLFWLDPRPLLPGARVLVKYGTTTVQAIVESLIGRRELETLDLVPAERLDINDIGTARVRLASPLPLLAYAEHRRAGAFVVIHPHDGATLAAGTVSPEAA